MRVSGFHEISCRLPVDRRAWNCIANGWGLIRCCAPAYNTAMAQYQWLIYAILGAVAAAVIAPLGKRGTEGLDSNVVTAVRSAFQALVVMIVVTAMGSWSNLKSFHPRAFLFAALA